MKPITPPQPALTGGTDQPETPCRTAYDTWATTRAYTKEHGLPYSPWCYDALIDNPRNHAALAETTDLCQRCPLATACLTQRHGGDEWADAVVRELRRRERRRKAAIARAS